MNRKRQQSKPEEKMGAMQKGDTALPFTGERYVPSVQGEIRLEHIHRYAVALDIASEKDVLDIACGEGYGSFLLSTVARRVTGVDISEQAVRHANATYGSKDNLAFKRSNAAKINLPDDSFDVVISFETIEHLTEQSQMLSEIRRVLRANGVLLISSPNRPVYSGVSKNHNQFHVKELDLMELDTLIRKQFHAVRYLGQRLAVGSIVQPLGESSSTLMHAWRDDGVNALRTVGELSEPVYFLAICAAAEAAIPTIEASIMQPEKLDLLKQYVGFANWATETNKELELARRLHSDLSEEHHKVATWAKSLDQQIAALHEKLSERDRQFVVLCDQEVKLGKRVVELEEELKAKQAELSHVVFERDSEGSALAQIIEELNGLRQLYARHEQALNQAETKVQCFVKEVSELNQALLQCDQQITALSDELAKYRELARYSEDKLKSAQADFSQAVSAKGTRIAHLDQVVVALNEKIAELNQELFDIQHKLILRQQAHVNEMQQRALQFEQEKARLALSYTAREHALHDRLLTAHADLHKIDQEWVQKYSRQTRLVTEEKAALQYQMRALQQQLHESDREKMKLSVANADREQQFHERLLATQSDLHKLDKEWATKVAAQQLALSESHRNIAELRAQLLQYIDAAKQIAATSQSAQRILQHELDTIECSMTWRITKPLRDLAQKCFPAESTQSPIPQHQKAFDVAPATFAGGESTATHYDPMNRLFAEGCMSTNFLAPAPRPATLPSSLDELLDQHDETFIHVSYHIFLRRAPDTNGMAHYLRRLRRGVGKVQIIDELRRSNEGQMHAVTLAGLEDAIRRDRWSRLPFIGAMLGQRGRSQKLQAIENHLFLISEENARRFDQQENAIASLQQVVVQQAQAIAVSASMRELGYSSMDSWRAIEEMLSREGMEFLNVLFHLALDRAPEEYEANHYLDVLGKGTRKLQIVEALFSCDECKSRLAKAVSALPLSASKAVAQTKIRPILEEVSKAAAESIHFPQFDEPSVSVVIPVYGKLAYTLTCLKSIQTNLPAVEFEIIVVDDKSPDDTVAGLAKIQGLKLVVNTENLGFIRSCNHGAKHAKGKYLCFLNNDTEVTRDWLDELLRTFHEFPGTGLTGSKLVYPDGSLQEAGGILWRDGSAWNFGRNQDPSLPVYNYAREVDYCSGASIMIPKALFDEFGGFDERYLPAYCEDSDLALKVRESGHRVIYQPLSVVVHYEGITSGTDISTGAKAYQVENSKKLFERWKDRLMHHQPNGTEVDQAKDRMAKRRVLVLDHCTPTPDQDAGSVTVLNLLLLLREMDFQVTFIPEDNFLYMPEYTTRLQRAGIEVLYAPFFTSVEQHLKESGHRYDLAFLFRPGVIERHLRAVRNNCPKTKVLYHTVDLHYLRMMREAELQADAEKSKAAKEMKQREFDAIRAVDATIVHSTAEFEILRKDFPREKIHVFPLIMNVCGTQKRYRDRSDLVFVGGYQHTPNVDAVEFFIKEVMPLLRSRLPGVRFYAVGSKPPQMIQNLASDDVIITGFVQDLNPFLDRMRVAVAPLRYGAGIKGKIGSAMAVGLPTVATTLAAEGMSLTHSQNILLADGPEAFAAEVVRIYLDESLWSDLSRAGLKFAEKEWGANAAWNTLDLILGDLGLPSCRKGSPLSLYSSDPAMSSISIVSDSLTTPPAARNEGYETKIRQELAIFEKQEKVHDLPDIFHYWSNKFMLPLVQAAGFTSIENFFSSTFIDSLKETGTVQPHFVSIGAGNCDLEVAIAKSLHESGCNNFVFECIELNPIMLERGNSIAQRNGVGQFMKFTEADFNTWTPTHIYQGVMANQSLHHVTDLEHLFEQVKKCIHLDGVFAISDMIGRNGHQRWPEALELVHRFWKDLPDEYKFNLMLNRYESMYEDWDCSKEGFEGIRAQDVLPLLIEHFECHKFIGFGSAIDVFVDRCFGHHFDPNSEKDRSFIDRVHEADERGLQRGELTPTHMMAVFKLAPCQTLFVSRGITPQKSVRFDLSVTNSVETTE